jgi:hypothetical protein
MFRNRWFPEWNRSWQPRKRARRAVAKRRSRSLVRIEEFEPRVTPSCSVGVTSRVLTVNCDSSINTVNYDDNGVNTNVNGVIIADSTFDSFQINIGTGGGTVNLLEALHSGGISEVGFGNVTVNVSPTVHNLDSIAPLNITGGSGVDALVVNDQANSNPHTYAMTATSVSRGNPINFGTLMNFVTVNGGGGANTYNITGTGGINLTTLNTGSGNDTINVENTNSGRPLAVNEGGSGNDTVNVSPSARNLNNVQGNVTITGNAGFDRLFVDDQNISTARSYTVTATSISRTSSGTITFGTLMNFVELNGGSGANTYSITGTGGLNETKLNTGGGNDIINLENTTRDLVIDEQGSGNDTVNVSPTARLLNTIQGAVGIESNAGHDVLIVNDQNDNVGLTYTFGVGTIAETGSATIAFGSIDDVIFNGGNGDDTYNLIGTPGFQTCLLNAGATNGHHDVFNIGHATSALTVQLGGRTDVVNVSSSDHNLNTILATVTINGHASLGIDQLNIDDQANTSSGLTYTLANNQVRRTGSSAIISYNAGLGLVTVNAATETGGNTYNVTGTDAGSETRLNLNNGSSSGHDVVNVQATNGSLIVNGPTLGETVNVGNAGSVQAIVGQVFLSRAASLVVNGGAGSPPQTVRMGTSVGNGIISGLAPALIEYDDIVLGGVTVNTGLGDTINVQATVAHGLTMVNSGGNATFNVGDAINTLNEILGPLNVNGGAAGIATLNINDQGSTVPHHYSVTSHFVTRSPGGPTIGFSNIGTLILHAGAHFFGPGPANVVDVLSTDANTAVAIDAAGGTSVNVGNDQDGLDELQGPLTVTGDGSVALNVNDPMTGAGREYDLKPNQLVRSNAAPIVFSDVQEEVLSAGAQGNLFDIDGIAQGTPATLNAGNGGDLVRMRQHELIQDALTVNGQGNTALGYVAYTTNVFVDLQLGVATDIAAFSGLSRITGGGGNNILVGDGNEDIIGGSGRNLIISGGGSGQLVGGGQGDILIGGITAYDQDFNSLQAILAYWTGSGDDYLTRVANLRAGNGVPQLEAQITVFASGAANTITGNGDEAKGILNLFYVTETGTVTDPQPSEVVVDIDDGSHAPRGEATTPSASLLDSSAPPSKEGVPLNVLAVNRLFAATKTAEPLVAVVPSRHDAEDWGSGEFWSSNRNDGSTLL